MFNQLRIPYYIGGSVSSSLHGLPRQTYDVDVIMELEPFHVQPLFQALQTAYYLDEQALDDAVRRRFPYNVLHLKTMMKIDLIPLKQRAFTREEARRAQPLVLEEGAPPLRVATAEDALLTKLEWFDQGGRSSGRQWKDIWALSTNREACWIWLICIIGPRG